jgi:hypothetical protein
MDLKKKIDDDSDEMMSQPRLDSLGNYKTCIEIYTRHSWIWSEICLQCELEFAGYADSD